MKFTAIATQGRQDFSQWVTSYSLSYSEDGTKYTIYSVGGHQKVWMTMSKYGLLAQPFTNSLQVINT